MVSYFPSTKSSEEVKTLYFTGSYSKDLAESITSKLVVKLTDFKLSRFADGEISLDMGDDLFNSNVVILHSTQPPANDSLMELLLMVSTAKRAGASTITAVVPYLCYSRQTDKHTKGSPISSADVALLLQAVGLQRLITLDIHSVVCSGFYNHTLFESHLVHSVAVKYFLALNLHNVVVVAPDAGAQKRALNFTQEYNAILKDKPELLATTALVYKTRSEANKVDSVYISGSVEGMNVILVDDMIDTAGTIVKAAELLKERGALKVYAFVTHGLFSGPAIERINNSHFEKVVVTNSIQQPEAVTNSSKVVVLDTSEFLANLLKNQP
ncbi:phosphoribosyl pyrophosphate synthetase, putative [Theileria annulata]|uniref:ribose-phosphate diphosphokinase n=1 Tax=Theileria annulata TaxID=5874 RepID=Q4UII4_THEAN|nr:phosphoribosyl pyrophosphate synthetase, putative [Theileria annulata]CAI73105.1 phosphoribosyl pyrophosphate synthetase, putative [Theileria annulata]|eukprot:XP_953783.1 phosphoribosyl pyrophosphate synthetase, putative [Theileria annulata]